MRPSKAVGRIVFYFIIGLPLLHKDIQKTLKLFKTALSAAYAFKALVSDP